MIHAKWSKFLFAQICCAHSSIVDDVCRCCWLSVFRVSSSFLCSSYISYAMNSMIVCYCFETQLQFETDCIYIECQNKMVNWNFMITIKQWTKWYDKRNQATHRTSTAIKCLTLICVSNSNKLNVCISICYLLFVIVAGFEAETNQRRREKKNWFDSWYWTYHLPKT